MRTRRIAFVDGLRAIAVMGVLAYHAAYNSLGVNVHSPPPSALMMLLREGCHGVDLFFVISGFCLAYPTLQQLYSRGSATLDIAGYAARRLVRIVPPYYCAIGVLLALFFILPRFGLVLPTPMMPNISWLGILRNALFLDGNGEYLAGPFWTLAIEFRWYFIFPVALWLWARSPRAFLTVFFFTIFLTATHAGSLDLLLLPGFLLGIIAADVHVRGSWFAPLAGLAFVPVVWYAVATTSSDWMNQPCLAWQLAAFLFVVAVGASRWCSRLFALKFITFFGIASYAIYLVHEPIVVLLEMHGINPILAGLGALTAGVAFWSTAERPFVEEPVRRKLLAELSFLSRWLTRAGISATLHLDAREATFAAEPMLEHNAPTVPNQPVMH